MCPLGSCPDCSIYFLLEIRTFSLRTSAKLKKKKIRAPRWNIREIENIYHLEHAANNVHEVFFVTKNTLNEECRIFRKKSENRGRSFQVPQGRSWPRGRPSRLTWRTLWSSGLNNKPAYSVLATQCYSICYIRYTCLSSFRLHYEVIK